MKRESSQPREKQGIKKKLIIAICTVLALLLLMFVAIAVLDFVSKKLSENKETHDFIFYEADYTENIFEDDEYMALIENGYINYCDMDNVTLGIDAEDAILYGADVKFMVDYISYMINGDVVSYNGCYSELYYTKEDPKDTFTKQKIYDVSIVKKAEQMISEDGVSYNQYIFSLNYKILKNNGTLRDDFLNGSRTQYIYVTDREGSLKIDGITVLKTSVK